MVHERGLDLGVIEAPWEAALVDELLLRLREPLLVTDESGTIRHASRSASLLLAKSERGLVGTSLISFLSSGSRRTFRRALGSRTDRTEFEVELELADGTISPVTLEIQRGQRGLFWRIEDRPTAEQAVEVDLGRIADGLSEGLAAVDPTLRVVIANRAAQRILGVRPEEQVPDEWGRFALGGFVDALFTTDAIHGEALVEPSEGVTYMLTGMPTRGRRLALLLVTDVSRRERRDRLEREFIANAAHELQTPLTGIVGAVQLLDSGALDRPEERDLFLAHLRRESERLVRLVDSLLMLARLRASETVERSHVPVRALLEEVAGRLAPSDGVRVEVLAPTDLVAWTNASLVERILTNAAENSAKFARSGRILLRGIRTGGGVALEVEDTGPGMPPELLELAVERFYRGEQSGEGFGLGLSIAQQAAEAVGGSLELRSTPGVGTKVRLFLPDAG
jgi:signal transduction histidine kinase